jgi:phosphoglycerol transferase MdoB-like AlkP superfamily enzyme
MIEQLNTFILKHIAALEMTGVLMRIFSFSLVSWMGPDSPFMFVWVFNTIDAILLAWCSILKKDKAYTLLNGFWILVGAVGIYRAA